MQILLDHQLHDYLSTIIPKLCKEKNENINIIDNLVINQIAKTSNQKQCRECGRNEIKNSKHNRSFESLDKTNKLSVQMKSFSYKARMQRISYIKSKFDLPIINSSELIWPIPVTFDEAQLQLAETSLKKEEIIFTIETLIGSLNEAKRPQFRGLKSKKKDELLTILQQLRDLHNMTNADEIKEEETI
ncbi:5126_t:CDS:2 [Cetraspora pellucida]|uniref:5126_t:CDS:1 n=1 Tax=Cetraspora pellucida TaxID=1433469 RepID=A0A9N9B0P0_9GLOM|nr:5126_t:CDS:2 [Cetraspora pellucida]